MMHTRRLLGFQRASARLLRRGTSAPGPYSYLVQCQARTYSSQQPEASSTFGSSILKVLSAFLGGVAVTSVLISTENGRAYLVGGGNLSAPFSGSATWQLFYDNVPEYKALTLEEADERLAYSNDAKDELMPAMPTPTHTKQVASNQPMEDAIVKGLIQGTDRVYQVWGIFDGHAGWATAFTLREKLIPWLSMHLATLEKPEPSDSGGSSESRFSSAIVTSIKNAFVSFDKHLEAECVATLSPAFMQEPNALAKAFAAQAPFAAGSCALVCIYDPVDRKLYTACVGDSRAVLLRPTTATSVAEQFSSYTVLSLSDDQNCSNLSEVARIQADHPGETPISDGKPPRLLGIMITRAFGDARWKLPADLVSTIADKFHGSDPRPNALTPPYLTADPEVTVTRVENGDVLVMGSDGLWDHLSNDHAAVAMSLWQSRFGKSESRHSRSRSSAPKREGEVSADEQKFVGIDGEDSGWVSEEKSLVAEDENAATSLIRNSFGGNRRGLFQAVMSVLSPVRRNIADDVSVHVVFF